ncbi:DUF3027 domain-containing protein [Corynebacterium sp.]|uniref:DUF3027 domain-containing protein n=1 Tax=Corynebacterium sp. TaxID=1720 RepID=UPI002A90EC37|nr:DUF3027 domain-containing protein [Corynebacterium sp.]MDY5785316.1 DUF3027 domain-containing protein [Corynebacterium sp.]
MHDVAHNRGVSDKSRSSRTSPLLGSRAVAIAREALEEIADGEIGEHIGVAGVSRNVATHRFAASVPGYPGWEWNAVVACATNSTWVTVNEVALVPSPTGDALEAPEWVPYAERLRPGDLGPGDLMEPAPDDARLTDDSFSRDAVTFPGRDTKKFLTRRGLADAATRWRTGDYGPNSEFASQAALYCRSCAFWVPLGEPVGDNFGVCVNEFSADGTVVAASYGCGAHSDTKVATDIDSGEAFDDEKPLY